MEQIYSEWREVGEGWELEVQFDAGYADALTRDDPTAPAPTRDWLLERTEPEWEEMRRETERYFRAYFLVTNNGYPCLLYTSPSPRDKRQSRMPSSA